MTCLLRLARGFKEGENYFKYKLIPDVSGSLSCLYLIYDLANWFIDWYSGLRQRVVLWLVANHPEGGS
jgi:hypothetical protein